MYMALGMMIMGILIGRLLRRPLGKLPIASIMFAAVLVMLYLLGMQIGGNGNIFAELGNLGWGALCLTLCAMAGTIVLCLIPQRMAMRHHKSGHAR